MFIGSVAPEHGEATQELTARALERECGHHKRTQNAVPAHDPQRSVYRRTLPNGDGKRMRRRVGSLAPLCAGSKGRSPVCKRHLAAILEIEAEQGFRSFVDKDQVARRIDHEGRDRQAVGQLANQDQLNR